MRLALVHGFTQTGASWDGIRTALRARGHDVVCPDAPGHGSKAAVAADLETGAELLGVEVGRAAWIGYSMGGRLCLHLALARPDLVEGLVLVSTTAGIDDDAERGARRRADDAQADDIERLGVAAFVDRWLRGPLWATLPRDRAGVEHRLSNTVDGLASSLRLAGTGTQIPLWGRLPEIETDVLVVTGGLDAKFDAVGERLARTIGPRASRRTVPNAGHAVPWEQPQAFVDLVDAWVTQTVTETH